MDGFLGGGEEDLAGGGGCGGMDLITLRRIGHVRGDRSELLLQKGIRFCLTIAGHAMGVSVGFDDIMLSHRV